MVKGPGVQHLLTKGTGERVQPPNLDKHPKWQHVFVQSTDGERQLTKSTKYLFCKCNLRTHAHMLHAHMLHAQMLPDLAP